MTDAVQQIETAIETYELPLAAPFEIARGKTRAVEVVVVRIDDGEHVGIGAASPSNYYGEDVESVRTELPKLLECVETVPDPTSVRLIEGKLRKTTTEDAAARAAVSIAVHDRAAKHFGSPLYKLWGFDPGNAPRTSFSIGIAPSETMAERAEAAVERGFDALKLKLGTDDDRARLAAVRDAVPDAAIRVDANGAWDREEALDRLEFLETHDVALLEQPVPADDLDALRAVTEGTEIPVAADESCVDESDVHDVVGRCDLVVCKLMKCGGPWAAREQIAAAHDRGLDVMLGCMVESNASIAAGWQLAPMVERVDLDGSLLLAEDPYEGVPLHAGDPALGELERAGTGARLRDAE